MIKLIWNEPNFSEVVLDNLTRMPEDQLALEDQSALSIGIDLQGKHFNLTTSGLLVFSRSLSSFVSNMENRKSSTLYIEDDDAVSLIVELENEACDCRLYWSGKVHARELVSFESVMRTVKSYVGSFNNFIVSHGLIKFQVPSIVT